MMNDRQILNIMQLAGGTFPSGGFSQSMGLETYVQSGAVKDGETFKAFITSYLFSTVSSCEGLIVKEAAQHAEKGCLEELKTLEELSRAVKLTRESREASLRMGKAVLRIMSDVLENELISGLKGAFGTSGVTFPVIYGALCGVLAVDVRLSIEAFVYNTANALVQSAIKLVPLGNTEAQKILFDLQPVMKEVSDRVMKRTLEDISNFCPGFDIAGILHEDLPVRLYMS